MIKLTLEQVYEQIPERFKGQIEIVEYFYHNKMIIRTKYGLSRMSLNSLQKLENFSIKSALNRTEFFINMMLERFPDYEKHFIIIGEFTRSNKGILIQGKYSQHSIKPDILLKGAQPHIRNSTNPNEYYINYFNELHENKYTYPDYEYCGSSCIVKINCAIHGQFEQKNYIHMMKSGCQSCAEDKRVSGYAKSDFIKNAKGREGLLYLIKCSNGTESFYKIGITLRRLKKRFSAKKDMPYEYEVIKELKSLDIEMVYTKEKELFKLYKRKYSYRPLISFHGESECFNLYLPIKEIINNLK